MGRIPLSGLMVFSVCAESESFTQAASRLFVTQGAVSKQIKQLEDFLGVKLFHRHPHYIKLTEEGEIFIRPIKEAFDKINQAVSQVTQNKKMQLRIVAAPTFATRWLAIHLHDFHYQYPFIEIIVLDAMSKQIIDCEIIYDNKNPKDNAKLLMLEKNIAVCAAHLFENKIEKIFAGRKILHILDGEYKLSLWQDWIDLTHLPINPSEGLSFSTQDQVINATMSGLGIAIIDKNMILEQLRTLWLFPITSHVLEGPYGYWIQVKEPDNPASILFENWIMMRALMG